MVVLDAIRLRGLQSEKLAISSRGLLSPTACHCRVKMDEVKKREEEETVEEGASGVSARGFRGTTSDRCRLAEIRSAELGQQHLHPNSLLHPDQGRVAIDK